MRQLTAFFLIILLFAAPARAQSSQTPTNSHDKFVKVAVGAGLLALGALVAAKSSETVTTNGSEVSSHSTTQLATGLVIAGAGGIVLWLGLRDHGPASPHTGFGVTANGQSGSVVVRRSW